MVNSPLTCVLFNIDTNQASILRQIVAGPRARHPEAGLDLCYVTDNIIATSGPSSAWPKKAYRNPTDQLVKFLDYKHGGDWSIFEFRAEGTGYPDSEVYHRIHHFPWPDHHPPPFAVIPNLMAAMRNWIQRTDEDGVSKEKKKRVAVVHCKAGKGRSGTVASSYLISEEGWTAAEAIQRFTERRMRVGFGAGVSIPSQVRWVGYVDRWTNKMGKKYVERPVEIVEVHVWGLRDGVKVAVEGYVENGKRIEVFHTFNRHEKTVVEETKVKPQQPSKSSSQSSKDSEKVTLSSPTEQTPQASTTNFNNFSNPLAANMQNVVLKPTSPIQLPTSDINIDFERRNQASSYTGLTMVTSLAHVWFNAYFEGGHDGQDSGVFEIDWEAMDGIKGSARKGTKALDRLKVVWQYVKTAAATPDGDLVASTTPLEKVITQPEKGEPVEEGQAADWRGEDTDPSHERGAKHSDGVDSGRPGGALLTMGAMVKQGAGSLSKELGLRERDPVSADISRAPSVERDAGDSDGEARMKKEYRAGEEDEHEGVRACGPEGEEYISAADGEEGLKSPVHDEGEEGRRDTHVGRGMEAGMGKVAGAVAKVKGDGGH